MTVEQTAAADLDAMEIDSAELRVLAARDYIAEQSAIVSRQINAVFLIAEFIDLAEANALRRPGAITVDTIDGWPIKLAAADYLTARSTLLGRYKGKARDRVLEILDEYVPPALRVSDKHRVRA